ncbi:MAG: 1-acyl-sn-glycerol-3-phosphate acyltransferase [Clostridia bacterium]|nr:1-acyl-sn-glycerol-3-phosphate acyltransferase [Clostridia bacterium]
MSLNNLKFKMNFVFNKTTTMALISALKNSYMKKNNVHLDYHKPQNKTFILISNHSDAADPGYEMASVGTYLRFVASDHVLRMKYVGWIFKNIGGVIVKHRERPSSELTAEIIKNLKAGVCVGLHAEGAMTVNGRSGYVSENTGKLVKDSGAALITYHFVGGYLRKPRWANSSRSGPIIGKFMGEYSAEELSKLSAHEITEIIRRDIYVNAYEEQRKNPYEYKGENLAESVERILFMCPKCSQVGKLHSSGDNLKCDCGYEVKMKSDSFFHDIGQGVVFDNVLDWDLWQREEWKKQVLSAEKGQLIYSEGGQIVKSVNNEVEELLSENAEISLYTDRIVIDLKNEKPEIVFEMDEIIQVSLAGKDSILLVDDKIFLDIRSQIPRSATKYIAAWRYLTGKNYY